MSKAAITRKRAEWFYQQRAYPRDHIPAGARVKAVKQLEQAVSRQRIPIHCYHLGLTYMKTGNRKLGAELLQAALKGDPSLPEAKLAQQALEGTR